MALVYRRPQHLSPAGAAFIARFEGVVLHPYNDPLGFATIGVGHLIGRRPVNARDRAKWKGFSRNDAMRLLQQDAESASAAVRNHVTARINQAQHDALVSFTFNVGTGGFEKSSLLRLLNTHKGTVKGVTGPLALAEVRSQLLRWVNAGSPVEAGLTARRLAEYKLFARGLYA